MEPPPPAPDERSITAWYDALKATLRLEPLPEAAIPLEAGELLYLASGPAWWIAEEDDPLFFPDAAGGAAIRREKRQVAGKLAGEGRLFLTNRRLVWQSAALHREWPLTHLNSAYAYMDHGVMLLIGLRLYTVRFRAESLLKWVTYIALIAPAVEAESGHRISTSHCGFAGGV